MTSKKNFFTNFAFFMLLSFTSAFCELQDMTEKDTNEIKIQLRVERRERNYDRESWEKILLKGDQYMESLEKNIPEDNDSFMDDLEKLIKEVYPIVKKDNSGIDGYLETYLYSNSIPESEGEGQDSTGYDPNFIKEGPDSVKKGQIFFIVKKDAIYNEKIWKEIFEIAQEYAIECESSFDENGEKLMLKSGEIMKTIYHLAKDEPSIHGSLNISATK